MTPLPPVPNVVRIRLVHSLGGSATTYTGMYLQYSSAPPSALILNELAAEIQSSYAEDCVSQLDEAYELTTVTCQDINSDLGAEGESTTPAVGSRSGTHNAVSICMVMEHAIARHYRGGKPKSFLPWGLDTDRASNITWNPSFVTSATTQWNAFTAAIVDAGIAGFTPVSFVNVSYYSGVNTPTFLPSGRAKQSPKLRVGGPVVDAITNSAGQSRFGSQRRRLHQ